MKHSVLTLLLLILLSCGIYAQKEAYTWTFGYYAGLSWLPENQRSFAATGLGGTANATLDNLPGIFTSKIYTDEGCFSISNKKGELLIYSDGIKIWNGDGTQIYTGLAGNPTSAQSGIVITYPRENDRFICIGIDAYNNNKMNYVKVHATNSSDAVVEGSAESFSGHSGLLGESMSSVRHANGTEWWIVAPGKGSPFHLNAWAVTSAGVQTTAPVVTTTTINAPSSQAQGYLKFTPSGKHFAWAAHGDNKLIYGDFDNSTGEFSNVRSLAITRAFGLEFSPNQKYLFVTNDSGTLYIYDMEALLSGATTHLKSISSFSGDYRPMQLDYSGRLWMVSRGNRDMYIIDNPNDAPDNLKMYRLSNFLSSGTSGRVGLPSFSASWWNIGDIESDPQLPVCKETEITFSAKLSSSDLSQIASIEWNFGDGTVIDDTNISASISRKHTYAKRGTYTLTLTPKKTGGEVITEGVKSMEVKIHSCTLPVNHNISVMGY